jgi:5-methylcytosine-specific restriction endonuclease McrA
VQFTAGQEYVELVQQAKDLASHALPHGAIEQLHLQAMRLLVAELKKRRHAALKPRCAAVKRRRAAEADSRQRGEADVSRQRGEADVSRQRGEVAGSSRTAKVESSERGNANLEPSSSRRQRHHVPAAVQRAVWSRDGSRCSYVDGRGVRCRETAFLELHHVHPDALGGPPTRANLTLRCRSHNALAAEHDFGREFMESKRRARLGKQPMSG